LVLKSIVRRLNTIAPVIEKSNSDWESSDSLKQSYYESDDSDHNSEDVNNKSSIKKIIKIQSKEECKSDNTDYNKFDVKIPVVSDLDSHLDKTMKNKDIHNISVGTFSTVSELDHEQKDNW
jgi:hypothetical protein